MSYPRALPPKVTESILAHPKQPACYFMSVTTDGSTEPLPLVLGVADYTTVMTLLQANDLEIQVDYLHFVARTGTVLALDVSWKGNGLDATFFCPFNFWERVAKNFESLVRGDKLMLGLADFSARLRGVKVINWNDGAMIGQYAQVADARETKMLEDGTYDYDAALKQFTPYYQERDRNKKYPRLN